MAQTTNNLTLTHRQFVSVTEAAQILHRTRNTIMRWAKQGRVKRKGKKYDLEALRLFAANRKEGPEVRHLAKLEREAESVKSDDVKEQRQELDKLLAAIESPAGLDGAIDRLRAMERTTYQLYVDAHENKSSESEQLRARLHADVVQHLIKAEGIVDVRKAVVAEEQSKVLTDLTAWAEPVRALIDQMPRSLAMRCNVTDPGTAEAALREWVLKELYPMMARKM
jgi:hypothetical protein